MDSPQRPLAPPPQSPVSSLVGEIASGSRVTDFQLFNKHNIYAPVDAILGESDLFFSGSSDGEVSCSRLGPVTGFRKMWDDSKRLYFRISWSDKHVIVYKSDFNRRYSAFCLLGVTVNPLVKPVKTIKAGKDISADTGLDVAHLLTSLDVSDNDVRDVSQLSTVKTSSSDPRFSEMVATFVKFCIEQQQRWTLNGEPDRGSDRVFMERKFTNLSRELDQGTTYLQEQLIPLLSSKGQSSTALPSVFHKSCVYRLMNKGETFKNAPNGIPDTDELDVFLNYAKEAMVEKSIFTSVHQNMGWDKYATTVMFVRDNVEEICGKLRQCSTLKDAFDTITGINNIGPFLGWQVLCPCSTRRPQGD